MTREWSRGISNCPNYQGKPVFLLGGVKVNKDLLSVLTCPINYELLKQTGLIITEATVMCLYYTLFSWFIYAKKKFSG